MKVYSRQLIVKILLKVFGYSYKVAIGEVECDRWRGNNAEAVEGTSFEKERSCMVALHMEEVAYVQVECDLAHFYEEMAYDSWEMVEVGTESNKGVDKVERAFGLTYN